MSKKIDAMVAEKVMGKRWYRAKDCEWLKSDYNGSRSLLAHMLRNNAAYMTDVPSDYNVPSDGSGVTTITPGFKQMAGVDQDWGTPDNYSTDISAAWEVVEKMRATEYGFEMFLMFGSTQWEVTFAHHTDRTKDAASETDSPALSICLAALRAVGVTESEIQEALK